MRGEVFLGTPHNAVESWMPFAGIGKFRAQAEQVMRRVGELWHRVRLPAAEHRMQLAKNLLDAGATLIAVQQNSHATSSEVNAMRGQRVTLMWNTEHEIPVGT